ncbi:MAG: glucose-6-phosphate isomerase [Christensenellales bacterium]|jgi:glucose-6-phosphate isomerase
MQKNIGKRSSDPFWQEKMRLKIDFSCMAWDYAAAARAEIAGRVEAKTADFPEEQQRVMEESVKKLRSPDDETLKENFITKDELKECEAIARKAHSSVSAMKGDPDKMMAWTLLPFNQSKEVSEILSMAERIRKDFDNFVVLGIGGSALGPIAVQQAINHLRYNELPKETRGGPRLYVEDNVDPERMASLLEVIDITKTCFNVVSKSGNTSETMSQYLIISDLLQKKMGKDYVKNMVITTDANKGNLLSIAKTEGIDRLVVPDGVGGRFSQLSPVGLLAAAVCGIDIEEMLAGAAYMDGLCMSDSLSENPALFAALMMFLSMKKGMNISVMMPYADSLKYMADWYAQLWAESLGKNVLRNGKSCAVGQTPVKALGVTDQHSQVQLYTEGPNDKLVTFLAVEKFRAETKIPGGCERFPDVSFLSGHSLNELIDAELRATRYALLKAGKPSYTIYLKEVNEFTLGQLMYLLEMMTAYCGELLNIDAFNQPGVEEGKNAAYAMLGRDGYAYKEVEISAFPEPMDEFVL